MRVANGMSKTVANFQRTCDSQFCWQCRETVKILSWRDRVLVVLIVCVYNGRLCSLKFVYQDGSSNGCNI